MGFVFADELHGTYFRGTAQRTGREGVNECLDGIGSFIQCPAYATDQMDDMAVVLRFFVKIHFHMVAIPAQVIACQVNKHHVFRIFFRVGNESSGQPCILLFVACPSSGTGYRVNRRPSVLNLAMGFR